MKNSSDEDTLAPRRRVKQHKSRKSEGAKTWEIESQKKSEDEVFNSNSELEKAAAKQPAPQQPQSVRMYHRRGRSYSRKRNMTSSEPEVSRFGVHCAEDGVSAIQTTGGEIKTQFNRKHLQRVIRTGKHSTPSSDLDTSSTQSQVQNSTDSDQLFTAPDPTKGSRRKALKQTSKIISPTYKTGDSNIPTQKVTKRRNPRRQKKGPKNYTDSGDESSSETIREDKSMKRTKLRKSLRVSERTMNRHALLVDKQPDHLKKTDISQPSVPKNVGKNSKPSVNNKTSKEYNKKTSKHPEFEQDLEGAWTEKELQKLNE